MKKVLLGLLVVFAINANAQVKFSAGLELGSAMIEGTGIGIGASGAGEYAMADNMGITGTVGYIYLTNDFEGLSTSIIPIMAGFKYYMESNESGIYGQGQLGFQMFKFSGDIMGQSFSETYTNLAIGIGGGYMVNSNIDLSATYTYVMGGDAEDGEQESYGYIGARIAYWF